MGITSANVDLVLYVQNHFRILYTETKICFFYIILHNEIVIKNFWYDSNLFIQNY